uniref:Uncharacterized protein n=1 Tax=Erythrolobus australicus TaxID=1077150 RepID=A0A7S1TL90_9RHOD
MVGGGLRGAVRGDQTAQSAESLTEMEAVWSELRRPRWSNTFPAQLARCAVHRAASVAQLETNLATSDKARCEHGDFEMSKRPMRAGAECLGSSQPAKACADAPRCSEPFVLGHNVSMDISHLSAVERSREVRIHLLRSGWLHWLEVAVRSFARMLTYTLYDLMCLGGLRDAGRIGKIFVEAGIDEALPPRGISLTRKFCEYLVPCGLSSLIISLHYRIRSRAQGRRESARAFFWLTLFRTAYRMARQAIIYRLFFRIGSKEYYLVTAGAIIAAFFREECIWDLFNVRRWPSHFCVTQGKRAILRATAYSLAFALPLERLSALFEPRRRRGNAKKFAFFSSWIVLSRLYALVTKSSAAHIPYISARLRAAAAVV